MDFMQGIPRYTITYCQYGDNRMKPTDIWTNYSNPNFKPMCKNGDSCHQKAPRGSKTGTQGLKNSKERSKIPEKFCEYIVKICEVEFMNKTMQISLGFSLDLTKILNQLTENETYMAQLGDITIKYIGAKEDTSKGKREVFEIERLCK